MKTLEIQTDKKKSINELINKATSEPKLRELLDKEASELTSIGNNTMIRHSEIGKTPIHEKEIIDYLFHRLFALCTILLKKSNRYNSKSNATEDIDNMNLSDIPF